jgi:hypothetical protein
VKVQNVIGTAAKAHAFTKIAGKILRSTNPQDLLHGSKLSGELRRASMDLTRSLSDLRRP